MNNEEMIAELESVEKRTIALKKDAAPVEQEIYDSALQSLRKAINSLKSLDEGVK